MQLPFASSLLPAPLVLVPRGEGGKEGEHPPWHGSCSEPGCKPTRSPGKELTYTPGKGKQTNSLYSPIRTLPSSPGGTWNMEFAKGLNCSSPAKAAGKWELKSGAGGAMAADKDLDSSKAKSTNAQGGCGTERLKTAPLPSSSSGGSQQKWGWRRMISPNPVQEMCRVVGGPTNTMQLSKEAFTPAHDILSARYSGLGSWFLFSWFMQRKGAQRYGPSGVGVSMGCLCSAGRAVTCVR